MTTADTLTERDIVINIQRHLLPSLDFIDAFQDRQPMPDTVDTHFLQFVMLQRNKRFAHDPVFCQVQVQQSALPIDVRAYSPRNVPQYWSRPSEVINSTHSSTVHSEMIDRGVRGPSLE